MQLDSRSCCRGRDSPSRRWPGIMSLSDIPKAMRRAALPGLDILTHAMADQSRDEGLETGGAGASGGSPQHLLLEQVYAQLRAIAQQRISEEAPGHTLQATALVHEAWLKLCNSSSVMALGRAQFVFTAAE